jgi:HupE / UreJ protein
MRFLSFLLALPAWGHVVSMSSGDLTVNGARAHYELRMPLYEISHVNDPGRTLLDHIHFSGARLVSHECLADTARDVYLCRAEYEWPAPVDTVEAECTFPSITVPNHVHLLRAEMSGKHDEAVFDLSFTHATLRFRPPTAAETFFTQAGAGFVRALEGVVQVLFLGTLVLAARSRRELLALAVMFIAGQAATVFLVPRTSWQPAPRFAEAAAALTIAYVSVEILMLPKAGSRWAIAGVLGAFHGLYFHLFVQNTGYSPALVLFGAAVAETAAVGVLAMIFARLRRWTRVFASALLLFGLVWFALRLRG